MAADPFGALLDEPFEPVAGADDGPLAGTTFVAKDLFAVAGHVVGAGQPTWAETHAASPANAPAVQRLLDAGSTLVGRAHTSQMAYSLSGRDTPGGGPENPAAPGFDTGGSSSGSAAAVAGGLVDLGLGTDTLGSIRVPASYGGVFGWRPTHGLVPLDDVHPLAASLDTVGLLACDPGLLRTGAEVLAGVDLPATTPGRVLLAAEAFALLDADLVDPLLGAAEAWAPTDSVDLAPDGLTLVDLTAVVRDVQGPEFARAHRAWIEEHRPTFLPAVAERIEHALAVSPEAEAAAGTVRRRLREHLAAVLGPGDVVVVPLAGRPATRAADDLEYAEARRIAASLSVVGSLAGLPTVAVPAVVVEGTPIGLGLLGAPGADGLLLSLAGGRPPAPPATRPAVA
jgi:amidase